MATTSAAVQPDEHLQRIVSDYLQKKLTKPHTPQDALNICWTLMRAAARVWQLTAETSEASGAMLTARNFEDAAKRAFLAEQVSLGKPTA